MTNPVNKGRVSTPEDPHGSELMVWIRDHLAHTGEACLPWPFGRDGRGYGHFGRRGKNYKVHRYMCERVHGASPAPDYQAAHSCGNGHEGCVNPQHLSWKTPSANYKESAPHPRHKLTPAMVAEIRANRAEKPDVIARRLGVNERTIRKIKAGTTWKTGQVATGGGAKGDPRNPFAIGTKRNAVS
jgi:hypothetical protein